ncbi:hypothetical protein BDB01DRAFT_125280 [Pilobolus umbonatus]|nr:hypothetical protein BDB01DRAFT_125280 [Pilobolus umbonatus]
MSINPETPQMKQNIQYVYAQNDEQGIQTTGKNPDDCFSTGGLLFLLGFCCFPLWCVGSCYPKEKSRFKKLNRIMAVLGSIVVIGVIVIAVVLTMKSKKEFDETVSAIESSRSSRLASRTTDFSDATTSDFFAGFPTEAFAEMPTDLFDNMPTWA